MNSRIVLVLCAVALVAGCGSDAIGTDSSCTGLVAGDLVITEVLADAEGADDGQEYVEIYNATGSAVDLQGVDIRTSPKDNAENTTSRQLDSFSVPAGAYVVIGNFELEEGATLPGHVDLTTGSGQNSLRNSDNRVEIVCGDAVVDAITYSTTASGRAKQLNGNIAPDAVQNDDEANWCDAADTDTEFTPGNFGTPGAANSTCEAGPSADTCVDGGTARDIVKPAAGDVEITEWMPNPEGLDGDLEWFELLVNNPFDLNALQIGAGGELRETIGGTDCLAVTAGEYIVIGKTESAAPTVDAIFGFSLGNNDEQSIVIGVDDTIIDTASYTGSTSGRSWQLDGDGALCLTEERIDNEYAPGNLGTPGAANATCPPVLMAGQCLDEDTGMARDIVAPTMGQLEISEWLANPAGTGTDDLEWIEIRATANVDLNGLVLSDAANSTDPLANVDCVSVSAGDHVVFVRDAAAAPGSGITDFVDEFGFGLNNGGDDISISVDGTTIDMVTASSATAKDGIAEQVDGSGAQCFVDATTPPAAEYNLGDGNFGSPGEANADCVVP